MTALPQSLLWAAGPGYTEQAQVTNWPARIALVVVVLLVIGLACWGMWRGWQNRARRQEHIPAPVAPPAALAAAGGAAVRGRYLGSTTAGDWLDRVVVHHLGVVSNADLVVADEGVLFEREGEPDLFVPRASLREVRLDRGIAGEVYEQGGVVVLTWQLGEALLDTGFRANRTQDHVDVMDALHRLAPTTGGAR